MKIITYYLSMVILFIGLSGCGGNNTASGVAHDNVKVVDVSSIITHEHIVHSGSLDRYEVVYKKDTVKSMLVTSAVTQKASDIKVDDIIVHGIGVKTPNGSLMKVIGVTEYTDQIVVIGEQATLVDLFKDLNLNMTKRLAPPGNPNSIVFAQGVTDGKVVATGSVVSASGNTLNFSENISKTITEGGSSATITGNVKFNLDINLNANINSHWEFWEDTINMSFTATPDLTYELSAVMTGTFSQKKKVEIASYTLDAFDVQVGPVPVVFVPHVVVNLIISESISVEVSTSYSVEHKRSYTLAYSNSNWSHTTGDAVNTHNFTAPTLSGSENFNAGTNIELVLDVYDVAGPSVGINPFIELSADSSIWDFYMGIAADIGFALDVFGDDISNPTIDIPIEKSKLASGTF
ncbi:MAG: hypothetical protein GQ570_10790 [Helicobacteraceae bacterium]|nr:hypothetical protein [Helicobacteraceae bacterium]